MISDVQLLVSGTKLVNLFLQSRQGNIFLLFLDRDYIDLFVWEKYSQERKGKQGGSQM